MPTYRVKLTQPVGWTVDASHIGTAARLASEWHKAGHYQVSVTYKADEPGDTTEKSLIVPWHMVGFIDPVPFPTVNAKGD